MKFIARYIHRRGESPEYHRTVYADSINEAIKLAERFTRKGFICCGVKSEAI